MDVSSKEKAVVASGIINGLGSIGPVIQELVIGSKPHTDKVPSFALGGDRRDQCPWMRRALALLQTATSGTLSQWQLRELTCHAFK